MGELTNQVARLEREAEEAREATKLADRVGEELEGGIDDVAAVYGALLELSGELDNQIAEHNFMAVEQSAYELQGLVDDRSLCRTIDLVLLMTALHEGSGLPGTSIEHRMEGIKEMETGHPTLTQQDLDEEFNETLRKAEATWDSIWGSDPWDSEEEREDHRVEHLHDARRDATTDRALRAGRHLMELCDYIADTLWEELTVSLRSGDLDGVAHTLKAAVIAADTAPGIYKLYEANLSEQYESNPDSLGDVGEQLMAFESWLQVQGRD
ncbi:hypothetical protein ACIO3O_27750 [Streptomyces sp. NPDC087440]|uniref:hypothetical protein n=1 Tax=Streptomyces sp. NPDC087440 TaxID=3365790 RepID=UPI0037F20C20